MRLWSDYSNEASLKKEGLCTLKGPRETEETEDEPADLGQKIITFISSPDWALSKHDLCSSGFQFHIARQASGAEMSTFKIHVPAKTRASSQVSKFQKTLSEWGSRVRTGSHCTRTSAEPVSWNQSSLVGCGGNILLWLAWKQPT